MIRKTQGTIYEVLNLTDNQIIEYDELMEKVSTPFKVTGKNNMSFPEETLVEYPMKLISEKKTKYIHLKLSYPKCEVEIDEFREIG